MSTVPDMTIGLDPILTKTRINFCAAEHCQFRDIRDLNCQFKEIEIGENGYCKQFLKEINSKEQRIYGPSEIADMISEESKEKYRQEGQLS